MTTETRILKDALYAIGIDAKVKSRKGIAKTKIVGITQKQILNLKQMLPSRLIINQERYFSTPEFRAKDLTRIDVILRYNLSDRIACLSIDQDFKREG